jgi:hypothetical protein
MKNKNLDKMLKDWDANIAPDASPTEKIKQNIMQNLDRPQPIEYPQSEYFYIPKKVAYVVGIAASICIAFLVGSKFNQASTNEPHPVECPPAGMVSLSQDEIKQLKKISSEIELLFPEGVKMISQVNDGDIQINTDDKKGLNNSKCKVLVRYTVLKKAEGDNSWKQVHVSNVITSPGEPLELKGKDKGYVWVYQADKDVYAVQSQLQLQANGETINLEYDGGQQLRIPQRIKTIHENNIEYRIYQDVVRI